MKRPKPKRKYHTAIGTIIKGGPPGVPSDEEIALYVAFVQNFILGRMQVSDALYQQRGRAIDRVASHLARTVVPKRTPLYRGWIIEPEKVVGGKIIAEHPIPISFTRDRGVACFFADPRSTISGFIPQMRPRARGYVMRLTGWTPSQVLWTYEWNHHIPAPMTHGYGKLSSLTALDLGNRIGLSYNDVRIVDRNIREQKEVILKPLSRSAKTQVEPLDQADCPPTSELNARYAG